MISLLNKILTYLRTASIRNTIIVFVLKIIGIISSYIFAIVISKQYGAKGWGIFSLALGIATFGLLFGKLGFDTALLKYAAVYKNFNERGYLKNIFSSALKFIIPVCILVVGGIIFLSKFFSNLFSPTENIALYLVIISLSILPNVLILIISEGLRGLGLTNKYIFLQNIGIFFFSAAVIFFYSCLSSGGDKLLEIFIVYDIAVFLIFIIALYWWIGQFYNSATSQMSISWLEILKTSMPMFWSNAMFVIINWTDTLMLGMYSTDVEVGIYNAALKISNLVTLPLFVITSIVAPTFASTFAKKDFLGLKKTVNKSTFYIFILTLPIFIGTMSFPHFFIGLFGKDFQSGAVVLMILITGQFLKSLCGSTDFLLQMTGHEKIFQNIILVAMAINVGLNIVLIPIWGSLGAAVSNAVTMVSWNIIAVYFIKHKLQINAMINFSIIKYQYNKFIKHGTL